MKLARTRGGVHPEYHKKPTSALPVESLPLPQMLYLPLQQHVGTTAVPVVKVGEYVRKGQMIARAEGHLSAHIHAPTSGKIKFIADFTAPHPSGLPTLTIQLEPDGLDIADDELPDRDPFALSSKEISSIVSEAGIVGMGGAAFPSAVKLDQGSKGQIHTLIINGSECEPYLTCDDRLMQEHADGIVDGARIMMHALNAPCARIAIEGNKPEAIATMKAAASSWDNIAVVPMPVCYPMGSAKQMIQFITGKEVPAGGRSAELGVLVHNVATTFAVHQALRTGRPLISRLVTVGGGAIRSPRNFHVPLGTLVSDLIESSGGLKESPARLLSGGPMMGQIMPHAHVPIVKNTSGIIALIGSELQKDNTRPCIRCGRCVSVCPAGLLPLQMAARIRVDDVDGAAKIGLTDCISCGSCSYVCPSNIPLVHYFTFAKGELSSRREQQRQNDYIRGLTESRSKRLAEQKRAKAEELAKKKASSNNSKETVN